MRNATTNLAHCATMLVSIAGCAADPTGLMITGAVASGSLSLKDIFKTSTPDAKKLVADITKELKAGLDAPTFHMPAEGHQLLPQMIELSLPNPSDIVGQNLNTDALLELMLVNLTASEHKTAPIQTAFRALVRPSVLRLLTDPTFVGSLAPQIAKETLDRLAIQTEILNRLERHYGSLAKSLDDVRALHLQDIQLLAMRFDYPGDPDDPKSDLIKFLGDQAKVIAALQDNVTKLESKDPRYQNLLGAARADLANGQIDKARAQIGAARKTLHVAELIPALERDAEFAVLDAEAALAQSKPTEAFEILSAAADSFASIDKLTPALKRMDYEDILYAHGLRMGGEGIALAAQMNRDALKLCTKTDDPTLWANINQNLALALQEQGIRTDGTAGTKLLAQAVTAYRDALTVYTRADHPVDWAMTTQNLANALQTQGIRTDGTAGTKLLAEAVTAYRDALTVRTRADHPVDWAMTTQNLAVALEMQGTRTDGPAGTALLAEAVTAYRDALTVYTRTVHPVHWAGTTQNLAGALQTQGIRTDGTAGTKLLAQAVTAYRDALIVYTRADHPVDWAMTTQNLAAALSNQGIRTDGTAGAKLLAQAFTANREALTVYTRADHPVHWAMTQENIAIAERAIAQHAATSDPEPHWIAALAHVDAALEVFDPVHMPYNYTKATELRADILART